MRNEIINNSKCPAASSSFFTVTLVDIHILNHFLFTKLPVNIFRFNWLYFSSMLLIFENIDAIPSKNYPVQMLKESFLSDGYSINVEMACVR